MTARHIVALFAANAPGIQTITAAEARRLITWFREVSAPLPRVGGFIRISKDFVIENAGEEFRLVRLPQAVITVDRDPSTTDYSRVPPTNACEECGGEGSHHIKQCPLEPGRIRGDEDGDQ